ncbi:hypothetical protein [Acidocella aromatica]|uniref:Uncharacterized protein n=1 Tax=Acidocella aromatica TaxID=1303579 RepID=A0A840VU70_9PROT|nr:hypothetical protein [Acidocella aromatica]MBB5373752.1 hypothetical protein [Acidocella aromatica]
MAKAGKTQKLLKPTMVTIAAAAAWAATHEPESLTPASAGVWGLEVLAVALLVRAVLALFTPAVALGIVLLRAAMQQASGKEAES